MPATLRVPRTAFALIWLLALAGTGLAQPCNPVVDGTYCAEEKKRKVDTRRPTFAPIGNIGEDISAGPDQPGTFGAITFRGNGTRCVGLMRRGRCG
jgi:hypothetical protein